MLFNTALLNMHSWGQAPYIDKNSKQIIDECQRYLDLYSQGIKPFFSTDLDYLIAQLNK